MLKILLMRHGESHGNRERRMMGHLDDGLTGRGQQQCQRLGSYLRQQEWQPSHIYTSPLRRAVESLLWLSQPWGWHLAGADWAGTDWTATHLTKTQALKVELLAPSSQEKGAPAIAATWHLAEFQAGILTGLTWAEAKQAYPTLCQALETTPDWIAIPAAETPHQGRDRATQFIRYLLAHHTTSDTVWVISHQWIMEHLIAVLLGCDRTWKMEIPNTALFEFWLAGDRSINDTIAAGISDYWQIKKFGTRPHLTEAANAGLKILHQNG